MACKTEHLTLTATPTTTPNNKTTKQAGFEAPPPAMERVGDLLAALSARGALSSTQLAQGLSRVRALLSDEALDAPKAPEAFGAIVARAKAEGWLPAEYEAE